MARRSKLEKNLHTANLKSERVFKPPVSKWMNAQVDPIMASFNKARPTTDTEAVEAVVDKFPAWKVVETAGIKTVTPAVKTATTMGNNISFKLLTGVRDDPLKKTSANAVHQIASKLIVEVTEGTKVAVNDIIKAGIEKGKGWKAIGRELRPKVGLNSRNLVTLANFEEDLLKRGDLSRTQIDARVGVRERKLHRDRNETIARTEAKRSMSEGQRLGYDSAGIKTLIWFALFDHDAECAAVNGHEFSIAAAAGLQPLHPRCRCLWQPKLSA